MHSICKVGPINYHLQQPGKHVDTQLYLLTCLKHNVNLLKMLKESAPVVLAITVTPTDPMELVDQFTNTFSSKPELTNLVHLEIKTPPGVVVTAAFSVPKFLGMESSRSLPAPGPAQLSWY